MRFGVGGLEKPWKSDSIKKLNQFSMKSWFINWWTKRWGERAKFAVILKITREQTINFIEKTNIPAKEKIDLSTGRYEIDWNPKTREKVERKFLPQERGESKVNDSSLNSDDSKDPPKVPD